MESFFLYCYFPFPLSSKVFPCQYLLLFGYITWLALALILLSNPISRITPDPARLWSAPTDGERRWGIRVRPLAIPEVSEIGERREHIFPSLPKGKMIRDSGPFRARAEKGCLIDIGRFDREKSHRLPPGPEKPEEDTRREGYGKAKGRARQQPRRLLGMEEKTLGSSPGETPQVQDGNLWIEI